MMLINCFDSSKSFCISYNIYDQQNGQKEAIKRGLQELRRESSGRGAWASKIYTTYQAVDDNQPQSTLHPEMQTITANLPKQRQ